MTAKKNKQNGVMEAPSPKAPAPIVDFTRGPALPPQAHYEVLKQIGVPPLSRNGRQSQYPFHLLEVGDGFRVDSSRCKNVGMSARSYGARHGVKILVRKDPQNAGKHLVVRAQ
jgi:hypothetical protein